MIESLVQFEGASVREACLALEVSESGFYAHRHKAQRPRRLEDAHIAEQINAVFEQSFHCYGSPRLVKALKNGALSVAKPACGA